MWNSHPLACVPRVGSWASITATISLQWDGSSESESLRTKNSSVWLLLDGLYLESLMMDGPLRSLAVATWETAMPDPFFTERSVERRRLWDTIVSSPTRSLPRVAVPSEGPGSWLKRLWLQERHGILPPEGEFKQIYSVTTDDP